MTALAIHGIRGCFMCKIIKGRMIGPREDGWKVKHILLLRNKIIN